MSRGAAAVAWRAVLGSSASLRNPFRCHHQGRRSLEALLSPESELRTGCGRWLAAASTLSTTPTTIDRQASTLPRQIGASPGTFPASSIRGRKVNRRSFAAEPVTREEKEERKERKGDDEDDGGSGKPTSTSTSSPTSATSWSSAGWSLDSCATLPNAISAARALSAPFLFQAITRGEWEVAGALLAFGAASDWADGAAARLLDARRRRSEGAPSSSSSSSSSPLGTYLDPLADKVFIGAAVAAAAGWGGGDGGGFAAAFDGGGEEAATAAEGEDEESGSRRKRRWPLLPSWLAAAIIGRDVVLVAGSLAARLRQFEGSRWPGGPEFFRLVDSGGNGKKEEEKEEEPRAKKPSAAPRIRPLFVSKLNTALQFATVGAAVADSGGWLDGGIGRARSFLSARSPPCSPAAGAAATGGEGGGGAAAAAVEAAAAAFASGSLGGSDVVAALAAATAAMTAVSGWAYASAYLRARRKF